MVSRPAKRGKSHTRPHAPTASAGPAMPDASTAPPAHTRPDTRSLALLAVTVALLALAVLPAVVRIAPTIYLDMEPGTEAAGQVAISLGPRGAAWLHVLSVLVAAAAVGVHRWLGGRIRWGACALAAVGMAVCAWQMPEHFDNRLYGGAWIAGVSLAVAAVHLGTHETPRRWLIAGLVAALVPLLFDALWYVLISHPQTVQQFEQHRTEVLQSQGFEVGSSHHLAYEQRLRATHAIGPFGMSNVFGSAAAALTALAVAVGVALRRDGARHWKPAALTGAVVLAGVVTTWLTESRGAMLALPIGLGAIALAWGGRRWPRWRWTVPTAAMLFLALAIGAVLLRGAAGPPTTHEGERSLLFRAHYWQGAANMIAEHLPGRALTGMGTNGFRAEYLRFKNPISPENVTSAHNVFVDYITMLGVGGAAWSLLLLLWLWQAARAASRGRWARSDDLEAEGTPKATGALRPLQRVEWWGLGLLLAAVFGLQWLLKASSYITTYEPGMQVNPFLYQVASVVLALIEHDVLWSAGGFALVFAVLLSARAGHTRGWMQAGLLGAAVVLLVHSQIEMSFFHLSAATVVWTLLGLAAAAHEPERETAARGGQSHPDDDRARWRWLPAGGLAIVALWLIVAAAGPITAHQHHAARASSALQRGEAWQAMTALDAAGEALPREETTLRWRVRLRLDLARMLAERGQREEAERQLGEAGHVLDEAAALSLPGPRLPRLRAQAKQMEAALLDREDAMHEAIEAMHHAVERSPHNLRDRIELGNLYWRTGQHALAAEQYRAAERISERYYLEPMNQLTSEQRTHIEQRLREVDGA